MAPTPTAQCDAGRSTASCADSRRCRCGRRLVAIVGTLVGAALLLTSLATAYLMRSDLMDGRRRGAAVGGPAGREPGPRRPALPPTGNFPSNYAFELQSQLGVVTRLPTGVTVTPDLPELAVDDPRVTSGEPFTVPSESGPLKWRFVAGRVTEPNATFAVGIPLSTVNHTVTRLLVTTGVIGTLALIVSIVLAWYAVRRAFRPAVADRGHRLRHRRRRPHPAHPGAPGRRRGDLAVAQPQRRC